MQPIICPTCQAEVIPHETHKQRWEDAFNTIFSNPLYQDLKQETKVQIAINLFNEINDFIISDNIGKQRMNTTKQIQSYKKENIKELKKEGKNA